MVDTRQFGFAMIRSRYVNNNAFVTGRLLFNRDGSYKTLKVGTYKKGQSATQELRVLAYLKSLDSVHDGHLCVRRACDTFQIDVPGGHHPCLVYEPLGVSLADYISLQATKGLSLPLVKFITTYLLFGIDYLHTSGVVHTGKYSSHSETCEQSTEAPFLNPDIKLDNIQQALPDDDTDILTRLVDAERKEPGLRKIVDERLTIYTSRNPDYKEDLPYPILGDLGMGVFGQTEFSGVIQPIPYRAPEVILRMKWNQSVDIWNLGVLVREEENSLLRAL